jgi:hypothetical protein
VLGELDAAARSGEVITFFELARSAVLQTFAARWRMSPEGITATELRTRLGTAGEDIAGLLALADAAKYSRDAPGGADLQRWSRVLRSQLAGGSV